LRTTNPIIFFEGGGANTAAKNGRGKTKKAGGGKHKQALKGKGSSRDPGTPIIIGEITTLQVAYLALLPQFNTIARPITHQIRRSEDVYLRRGLNSQERELRSGEWPGDRGRESL